MRMRRTLAAAATTVLAFTGLGAVASPVLAEQTGAAVAGSGVASWGISDYLNSGTFGRPVPSVANYTAPAAYDATTKLSSWGNGEATFNEDGTTTLDFEGTSVNWASGTGGGWISFADPQATFDASGNGEVTAVVAGGTANGTWSASTAGVGPQRVDIVDLAADPGASDASYPSSLSTLTYNLQTTASAYTWSGLKGRWSSALQTLLSGWTPWSTTVANSVTGTAPNTVIRYPAAFSFTVQRAVAATSAAATVNPGGALSVDVAGSGFAKTFPGVYVGIRQRSAGDPAYNGGSATALATNWVSNDAADVGTGDQSAATSIDDDGSFDTTLTVPADVFAALDPTKLYSVITRKGHGMGQLPANADQITETPLDLSALKKTTTVSATTTGISFGQTASVAVTVAGADSAVPTGSVTLTNGDATVGTASLSNGGAVLAVLSLPVGTTVLGVQYSGTSQHWRSAGTVSVTVAEAALTASAPTVLGTAKVGSSLTAQVASWGDGVTLSYQWLANGVPIANATGPALTVTASLAGRTITVKVTGSKAGYVTADTTSAGAKVTKGSLKAAAPKVTGKAKVGQKLTAKPGAWSAGTAKAKLKYQWLANGTSIKGATKSTFKLTKKQKGKKISVKVTGTSTGYTTLAKTSARTKAVSK